MFARFSSADTVFVGGTPSRGDVSLNRFPQGVPSPVVPPAELTQVARIFPNVLMTSVGTVYPLGTFEPGETPVSGLTNSPTRVNAVSNDALSSGLEPIALWELIYGARAFTAAIVVDSFTTKGAAGFNEVHGPSAVISNKFEFLVDAPGFPFVAVR